MAPTISTDLRGYKTITVATKLGAVIVLALGLDLIPQGKLLWAAVLGVMAVGLAVFTEVADVEVEGEEEPGVLARIN